MNRLPGSGSCLFRLLTLLALLTMLGGCSVRQMVIGNLADELAAQGQSDEADLDLAREASAFYLKLSESVLRNDPGHLKLAEAVAAGFTQYAYAFVAFDAEQIEATDARAAERLRRRAAKLYGRAHRHAMNALEHEIPGFAARLASAEGGQALRLAPRQVGLAYWAAASWGGMISLSKDDANVLADFPLAIRLAELAASTDPDWGEGALVGLLGSFEAGRPGGRPERALALFDRSIALSSGRSVAALVSKAEACALTAGDRVLFEQLLRQGLAIVDAPGSPFALQNEVMRRRATWLLSRSDDLF